MAKMVFFPDNYTDRSTENGYQFEFHLNQRIRAQDWTPGINYREEAVGRCASCDNDSGGGKFCRHCGAPQAAAPQETKKFCTNCGNNLADAKFCGECGWPAG